MIAQDPEMLGYSGSLSEPFSFPGKKKKELVHYSSRLKLLTSFVLLAGLCVVPLYMMTGILAEKGYEMQDLRTQVITLEKQNESMRIEIAQLESPKRIQSIAESKLGMYVPKSAVYGSAGSQADQRRIRD